MYNLENIFSLIQEEDSVELLEKYYPQEALKELILYGLIDIQHETIVLTERGRNAKSIGIQKAIGGLQLEEGMKDFSREAVKRGSYLFHFCLICYIVIVLLFLMNMTV